MMSRLLTDASTSIRDKASASTSAGETPSSSSSRAAVEAEGVHATAGNVTEDTDDRSSAWTRRAESRPDERCRV